MDGREVWVLYVWLPLCIQLPTSTHLCPRGLFLLAWRLSTGPGPRSGLLPFFFFVFFHLHLHLCRLCVLLLLLLLLSFFFSSFYLLPFSSSLAAPPSPASEVLFPAVHSRACSPGPSQWSSYNGYRAPSKCSWHPTGSVHPVLSLNSAVSLRGLLHPSACAYDTLEALHCSAGRWAHCSLTLSIHPFIRQDSLHSWRVVPVCMLSSTD